MLVELEYETLEKATDKGGNPNWHPSDFTPLRDFDRFKRAFSRTPYKFAFQLITKMSQRNDKKSTFKVDPDVIGCVVANNVSARLRFPITPWILAHRFGHALQVDGLRSDEYRAIERALLRLMEHTFRSGEHQPARADWTSRFNIPRGRFVEGSERTDYGVHTSHKSGPFELVASLFLTMRSARRQEFTTDLEPFAEMATQYVINGKVTLRAPDAGPVDLVEKDFVNNAWEVSVTPKDGRSPFTVVSKEPELFEDNRESRYTVRKLPPQHKVSTVLAERLPDGLLQQCENEINENMDKLIRKVQGQVIAF